MITPRTPIQRQAISAPEKRPVLVRHKGFWFCGWAACGLALLLFSPPVSVHGASSAEKRTYTTWSDYAGRADSMQYSGLKQIDTANVGEIRLAWSYLAPGPTGRFSFNPLVVDNVMYVVGKGGAVVALEGETGRQIWTHPTLATPTNRGFNYWESKDRSDRRIIFSVDSFLQEINARTGVTINTFGNDGKVDLREGLGRDPKTIDSIQSGTPGRVFGNLIVLGSATGEMYDSPPGDLRAYDVLTGKLQWTFHTIPHPGEYGYETWPKDAWQRIGGTNAWGEISLDERRGILYVPLGSPTYDFYGADRKGAGLFGDCLVALDAKTGKRLWHFQFVHHDLWDYDPTAAPKLLTVRHNGKLVDVVAETTKFGFLYVFDRVTGEPLWPIEERPVPQSDVPGEQSWPTQPFPVKPPPFARQKFTPDDINPYLDPEERARLRTLVSNARNEGLFTPVSNTRDQVSMPGENGGANWGSTAADPETGMLYVRSYDAPTFHRLTLAPPPQQELLVGTPEQRGRAIYTRYCLPCHGPDRARITYPDSIDAANFKTTIRNGKRDMPAFSENKLEPENVAALMAYLRNPAASAPDEHAAEKSSKPRGPTRYYGPFGTILFARNGLVAISPPWCELVAYDLNEGDIKWRIPLGTTPGLAAKGITNTGSSHLLRNGPVVTAGGLIFVGSGADRMVHAFDKATGKLLWQAEIDANPDGIPAVYEVGGRQYIAFFAASGEGRESLDFKPGKPGAQGYYVFALPQNHSLTRR
jgi:quinoprotein glucose dehydrogenase